jgi:hypothetical protein
MKWLLFGLLIVACGTARAQSALPTELEDCTGPDANLCFDGDPTLIEEGCGARFEGYAGRIAWAALENVGPVTIAVQTWSSFASQTFIPLYVEVVRRVADTICNTTLAGRVVLVAGGSDRCGGTWESVGPIDLVRYGVPLGDNYSVQCVFFRTSPGVSARTVGFSCIRVTSTPTGTASGHWGVVKALYK